MHHLVTYVIEGIDRRVNSYLCDLYVYLKNMDGIGNPSGHNVGPAGGDMLAGNRQSVENSVIRIIARTLACDRYYLKIQENEK